MSTQPFHYRLQRPGPAHRVPAFGYVADTTHTRACAHLRVAAVIPFVSHQARTVSRGVHSLSRSSTDYQLRLRGPAVRSPQCRRAVLFSDAPPALHSWINF